MNIAKYIESKKVWAFLQEKGGAGKTTEATNVACGLALRGLNVLLADADPQGSSRDWNEKNNASKITVIGLDRESLAEDIKKHRNNYDVIIIDGAPGLTKLTASAVKAADIVLIPVQPSPYDIWATCDLIDVIKQRKEVAEEKPDSAIILSRVIKNTKLGKESSDALAEYGFPVFKSYTTQLVVYPTTAAEGKSVFDTTQDNQGKIEINNIIDEILERFIYVNIKD